MLLYNYRRCPFCIRVRMVLLFKEIPFEIKEEKLRDWSEEFLKIRPYKPSVPVLVHNNTTIIESAIIMEYLDELEPTLTPKDPLEKAKMRLWIHWSAQELRDAIEIYKYDEERKEQGLDQVKQCLNKIEDTLTNEYLQGPKPTLADFAVWPFVRQALRVDSKLTLGPKTKSWFERIEQDPKLKELMTKQ